MRKIKNVSERERESGRTRKRRDEDQREAMRD